MTPVVSFALALILSAAGVTQQIVSPENTLDAAPESIHFRFEDRHTAADFTLVDDRGDIRPDALAAFSHFVRCRRTGRWHPIHPRTLEIVTALSRHFGDAEIDIVSGYRARPYGAPHSKHFVGRAIDLRVKGVRARTVAAWLWRNFRHVGVGYYSTQQFVHIDTRPVDLRWIDSSRHGESSHPRYFARRPAPLPPGAPTLAWDRPRPARAPEADNTLLAHAALRNILGAAATR